MSTTAIGNGDGALVAAELLEKLTQQLGNDLSNSSASGQKSYNNAVTAAPASSGPPLNAVAATASNLPNIPSAPAQDTVSLSPEYRLTLEEDAHTGRPAIRNSVAPLTSTSPAAAPFERILQTGESAVPLRQLSRSEGQASKVPGQPLQAPFMAANASLNSALPGGNSDLSVATRQDMSHMVMEEVATADLAKLNKILQPASDRAILDSLLTRALQEVAKGNAERAVGYLADYATRDPQRAEALPQQPGLDSLQGNIDAMMNRMTIVARMSAETGLSRAEQTATARAGKMADWETHADVLIKLAHRFYEAGGYANYSRSSDLSRLVTEGSATSEGRPARALAASAAASSMAAPGFSQTVPGVNVPYWTSTDISAQGITGQSRMLTPRRYLSTPLDDVIQNLRDVKEITGLAMAQLWTRAPLLFLLSAWFSLGLVGGIAFAIGTRIWSDGLLGSVGNFAFDVWGVGFLALVCFGFYVRVMQRPRR